WLSTLMMSVAFTTLLEATSPTMPHLTGWERAAHFGIVAISLWPFPMTYHVFARFPTWQPPGRPWRVVQWTLYALMLFVFCPTWMVYFSALYRGGPVPDFLAAHPTLYLPAAQLRQRPLGVYFLLCLVLSVTVTTRNYRRLQDPGSHRRIRWVVASLLIACVPYSAIIFAHSLTGWISDASYDFYYPATFVAMTAIPLTFALAVWKDQLFDIRVLVRRGMQYLLARSALRALLVLPILL